MNEGLESLKISSTITERLNIKRNFQFFPFDKSCGGQLWTPHYVGNLYFIGIY